MYLYQCKFYPRTGYVSAFSLVHWSFKAENWEQAILFAHSFSDDTQTFLWEIKEFALTQEAKIHEC